MADATVIPTSLGVVLLAIQAQLVEFLAWDASRVVIDARTDQGHDLAGPTQAEQYVRLQVKARNPIPETVESRGRIYPHMKTAISCVLRTRVNLDRAISDESALTVASRGHLPVEHTLWDALICFQPVDEEDNWLITEPIKPRGASQPIKPPKEWMQSTIDFEVTFAMDLDQDYQ